MAKFKIGDKVKIKKDLIVGKQYGSYIFIGGMEDSLGKVYEIIGSYAPRVYILDYNDNSEDDYKYLFTEEMLESISEDAPSISPEKITITRNDNAFITEYFDGKETITHELKYMQSTNVKSSTGFKSAFKNIIEEIKRDEPYTGKVVYIGNSHVQFTKGKIYDVKIGRYFDDYNNLYGNEIPLTLNDIENDSEFVAIVE